MSLETRKCELRLDDGGDGRTLMGIAVPYNSPASIIDHRGEYTETFKPGALRKTIRERGDQIRIYWEHDDNKLPIGISSRMEETAAGALVHARISDTSLGNDILALAKDGVVGAFSVGFVVPPGGDRWSNDRSQRDVREAKLVEISVVREPAYAGAQITGIRSASVDIDDEFEELAQRISSYRNVSLDEARAFLTAQDTPEESSGALEEFWLRHYAHRADLHAFDIR